MENSRLDLGLVDSLVAESFGEPGSRTFRLLARTHGATVSLWLEKEQIVMLGDALEELLRRAPESADEDVMYVPHESFVGELDVRLGSLTVGYDPARRGFTFEVGDFESPFDFEEIRLVARRSDIQAMQSDIERIVAAGRPRCPLCGTPLTGEPHFCPQSNGHAHLRTET